MKFNKNGLQGSYDPRFDILYIHYKSIGHSYGEESSEGFVVFRELDSDRLVGYIIYDFKDKINRGVLDISQFDVIFKITIEQLTNEIRNGKLGNV